MADSEPITLTFDDLALMTPLEDGVMPVSFAEGVLLADDFSDPASGWPEEEHEDWTTLYQDGQYLMAILTANRAAWVTASNESYADFSLSADVLLESKEGDGTAGLLFRMQDADNYYYFEISDFGEYKIGAQVDGRWRSIAGGERAYSKHINIAGESNRVEVVCSGPEMSAYVNGELLATVTDAAFAKGRVGVIAQSTGDSGVVVALFDDFLVTSVGHR